MYNTRYVVARPGVIPTACRQGARCLERSAPVRAFSHQWPVQPFARPSAFASLSSEIAPFFRLMDDISRTPFENFLQQARQTPQVYQPRFDVKETETGYELRGELPGVDAENLNIEFTDAQTLVVRGRTEREHTEGQAPESNANAQALPTEPQQQPTLDDSASDAASVVSDSSYQRPSVNDVDAEGNEIATAASANVAADAAVVAQNSQQAVDEKQQQTNQERYWVSERSIGEFARTFSFPGRVDQDGVSANLRNGILSVVIPKAKAPETRRVSVQAA